ncbi:unnamed protein product, partial [Ectocarpus fasciculatus]
RGGTSALVRVCVKNHGSISFMKLNPTDTTVNLMYPLSWVMANSWCVARVPRALIVHEHTRCSRNDQCHQRHPDLTFLHQCNGCGALRNRHTYCVTALRLTSSSTAIVRQHYRIRLLAPLG